MARKTVVHHDGSHASIKLPRRIVQEAQIGKVTQSFSHRKDMYEGMPLHIFCTDDDDTVTDIVFGTIEKVSSHAHRRWAVRAQHKVDVTNFDLDNLVRL